MPQKVPSYLKADWKPLLHGGKAEAKGIKPVDIPSKKLREGMEIEKEHTTNPALQAEITSDHYVENDKYYSLLKKYVEKEGAEIEDKKKSSGIKPWLLGGLGLGGAAGGALLLRHLMSKGTGDVSVPVDGSETLQKMFKQTAGTFPQVTEGSSAYDPINKLETPANLVNSTLGLASTGATALSWLKNKLFGTSKIPPVISKIPGLGTIANKTFKTVAPIMGWNYGTNPQNREDLSWGINKTLGTHMSKDNPFFHTGAGLTYGAAAAANPTAFFLGSLGTDISKKIYNDRITGALQRGQTFENSKNMLKDILQGSGTAADLTEVLRSTPNFRAPEQEFIPLSRMIMQASKKLNVDPDKLIGRMINNGVM